jgi:hypothetical protein
MAFSWTNIANGDLASSIRAKINSIGNQVVTNTNNIATNTSNIATNTSNIATLQTKSNLLNLRLITFSNVTVATSAWASNSTYSNYPYRATVTCSGMLETDIAFVQFSPSQQESGLYIGASSLTNGVYIYASAIPSASITIPLIMGFRMVS